MNIKKKKGRRERPLERFEYLFSSQLPKTRFWVTQHKDRERERKKETQNALDLLRAVDLFFFHSPLFFSLSFFLSFFFFE